MLMFYKEDGSYDVKAFYEHRLIDEYQEGMVLVKMLAKHMVWNGAKKLGKY